MKKKLIALLSLGLLAWIALVGKTNAQLNTDVYLTILWGNLTIFSTWSFNFGSVTLSYDEQTLSGQFVDYFGVEDLKAHDSGYYTSVSVTNLSGSHAWNFMPASRVYMKVDWNTIDLISWSTNALVVLWTDFSSYVSLDTVRTFLKRDEAPNFWVTGKYWVLPRLQVIVPAYQGVDTYHGVLTYTLYDLSV